MGGKTKVGGTAYDMSPATVKVGGTAYKVQYGNTKIGGTKYQITFSPIPSEYQEVTYIKSTTTANYITLPILTQNNITAHYWCYAATADGVASTTGYLCHWGYYNSTSSTNQRAYLYRSSATGNWAFTARQDGKEASISSLSLVEGNGYEVTVKFANENPRITIDFNGSEASYSGSAVLSVGRPLYLWRPAGSGTSYRSQGGFGRFTITDANDATLMDLYPCYRKSDSVAGFYDLVSETFLENQGSGTLEAVT